MQVKYRRMGFKNGAIVVDDVVAFSPSQLPLSNACSFSALESWCQGKVDEWNRRAASMASRPSPASDVVCCYSLVGLSWPEETPLNLPGT